MRNNFYQHAENVLKSMWAPLPFPLPARALLSPETGKSPFCWHRHFTKKSPLFSSQKLVHNNLKLGKKSQICV
jgi:hypothetical protein